jgi:hypothetical protein
MTTDEQVAKLSEKLDQVVAELIQTQEEFRLTRGELQTTQETLRTTQGELQTTQEALTAAQGQIAELEKAKTPPPTFVKENKKKPQTEEKQPRKKREAQYNHARKRSAVPTHIVEHRLVECPDCHLRLGGISLARCREIMDVPALHPWKSRNIGSTKGGAHHAKDGMRHRWTSPSRRSGRDALEYDWPVRSPIYGHDALAAAPNPRGAPRTARLRGQSGRTCRTPASTL